MYESSCKVLRHLRGSPQQQTQSLPCLSQRLVFLAAALPPQSSWTQGRRRTAPSGRAAPSGVGAASSAAASMGPCVAPQHTTGPSDWQMLLPPCWTRQACMRRGLWRALARKQLGLPSLLAQQGGLPTGRRLPMPGHLSLWAPALQTLPAAADLPCRRGGVQRLGSGQLRKQANVRSRC